ncbi:MAG: hypothetical protein JNM29_08230 [Candidatus Odyssella sp.]|nr:hypothetical protein [Candidatus Odyssella sp.]
MRGSILLSLFIAFLATLLVATPAAAHGGHGHAQAVAAAALGVDTGASRVTADESEGERAHSHDGKQSCPADVNGCCSSHCCTSLALKIEPSFTSPIFPPEGVNAQNDRAPPDLALEAQFRPPCR